MEWKLTHDGTQYWLWLMDLRQPRHISVRELGKPWLGKKPTQFWIQRAKKSILKELSKKGALTQLCQETSKALNSG